MKKNIDANFAIAILALVCACLGFSLYFNAYSIKSGAAINLGNTYVQKDRQSQVEQQKVSNQKIQEGTKRVRGTIVEVARCPECTAQNQTLCGPCPDDTITVQEKTGTTTTIIVRNDTGMKKGYYADLVVDIPTNTFIAARSSIAPKDDSPYQEVSSDILKERRSEFPEIGDPGTGSGKMIEENIILYRGSKVLKNEVLIGFDANASNDQIKAVVASVDGKIRGSISAISVFKVRVDASNEQSLADAIKTLEAQTGVEYVEPNTIATTTTTGF